MGDNTSDGTFIELTASIVSAYVSNNSVSSADLPMLIGQVHSALTRVSSGHGEVTSEQVVREPGVYSVPLAPTAANGRWTLTADATDDLEQASHMSASTVVNRVLAEVTAAPSVLRVPPRGGAVTFGWRQTEPARIRVSVERPNGTAVRRLVDARLEAGPASAVWDGLDGFESYPEAWYFDR